MIICSSDLGFINNAYSIIDGDKKIILDIKDITTKEPVFEDKLVTIYDKYIEVFNKYNVSCFIFEMPVFSGKGDTGSKLAQVVGIIRLAAKQCGIDTIVPYSATHVKSIVTGNGKASKADIMCSVSKFFNINNEFTSSHTADSAAVGICYLKDQQLI